MKKILGLFFATFVLSSCMQEESELIKDLISKTESKSAKLSYTTQTIPKNRRTIDLEVEGSSRIKKEEEAQYFACQTALAIAWTFDTSQLNEYDAIRIKFTNPDFPKSTAILGESYYDYDTPDLLKARGLIYLGQDIIHSYYSGSEMLNSKRDSLERKQVDSLLSLVSPKGNLRKCEIIKFETLTDSSNNNYTGVLIWVTTTISEKAITILFDNKTRKVKEINKLKLK